MTSTHTGTQHVGVIDLGSNTVRLVVYAYEPGATYKLTDQVRQRVRLAEGFGEGGDGKRNRLQPGPIERAIEALNLFRSLCEVIEPVVQDMATFNDVVDGRLLELPPI